MNQELPKSMLDALAREATPADHPSPDVLSSFVEHTLAGEENRRVTDHLARCSECRDIVFLASSTEEPIADKRDWAAAVPRISPTPLTTTPAPQSMPSPSLRETTRRRWAWRMVWALPVAAAFLLVAGLLVRQRFMAVQPAPQLASKMASKELGQPPAEPPRVTEHQPSAEFAAPRSAGKTQTTTARAVRVPPQSLDTFAVRSNGPIESVAGSAPAKTAAPNALREPATITIGGPATTVAPAAPLVNSFAASEAGQAGAQPATTNKDQLAPRLSIRSARAIHSQWRVTAEGHLERSTPEGWSQVLANQITTFRVVSVIGDDVWAGGNGGALFHSTDRGQQWKKVSLATSSGGETDTIVAIQFDDAQHGVVITEDGSRYSTRDGGTTWTRQ